MVGVLFKGGGVLFIAFVFIVIKLCIYQKYKQSGQEWSESLASSKITFIFEIKHNNIVTTYKAPINDC